MLRNEQGLPLRTSYSADVQEQTTLVDVGTIRPSPVQLLNVGNSSNFKNRVFTMPNSIQTIYNKIINSKK